MSEQSSPAVPIPTDGASAPRMAQGWLWYRGGYTDRGWGGSVEPGWKVSMVDGYVLFTSTGKLVEAYRRLTFPGATETFTCLGQSGGAYAHQLYPTRLAALEAAAANMRGGMNGGETEEDRARRRKVEAEYREQGLRQLTELEAEIDREKAV